MSPSTSVAEAARKVLGGGRWRCSSTPCWRDKAAFVTPPVTKFYLRSRPIHLYLCQQNYLNQSVISSWRIFIEGFFSLSASVHFQHSAELIRLLSGSNLNYTLQVTAAISPFLSKLRPRCVLCQKMSLLDLCLSPPHRDSNGQFHDFDPSPFWG